jgi:hypothetical protein
MASLGQLRNAAKALGVPGPVIRAARTPEALMAVISGFTMGDTPKAPAKKSARKAAANKAATTRPVKKASRPVATQPVTQPVKKTAVRPPAGKQTPTGSGMGRNVLGEIDYSQTEGWNAREGSAPDRIVKALRRFNGNREKVFDYLSEDIWDFMGRNKRDGSKRTKDEAESMLRYRISRTAWDFALQTDQHQVSTNRSRRNGHSNGVADKPRARAAVARAVKTTPAKTSPAKKASPAKKTATAASKTAVEAPKRRGRPPGSKNKPTAVAAPVEAPKRRGRPPGSKNKPRLTVPAAPARKKSRARG